MEQNVPVVVYDERVTVNTQLRQQKETDVFFQKKNFQFIYLV
jgi:RNase H-fold protein (predicted Holliday junction resolvase)